MQKKKYTHLSYEERFVIEKLLGRDLTIRHMASFLERSPNTISRELAKNSGSGTYTALKAQQKTRARRWRAKKQCLKVALDGFLCRLVEKKIRKRWSPEQISGHLEREYGISCSEKAIYKFVESRGLENFLFWGWNKKRGGRKRYTHTPPSDGRKYIDDRPDEVREAGHHELDFIISKHSAWVLMVLVDRLTKRSWVWKLPNRKRHTIRWAFAVLFSGIPIKSITTDNDIAFTCWDELETIIQAPIYFCHPYHSWEKGLVENTNRWIRCFVPKRRDLETVTQEELNEIDTFLNNRPRKVIGFRSAREYYQEMSGVLL